MELDPQTGLPAVARGEYRWKVYRSDEDGRQYVGLQRLRSGRIANPWEYVDFQRIVPAPGNYDADDPFPIISKADIQHTAGIIWKRHLRETADDRFNGTYPPDNINQKD